MIVVCDNIKLSLASHGAILLRVPLMLPYSLNLLQLDVKGQRALLILRKHLLLCYILLDMENDIFIARS